MSEPLSQSDDGKKYDALGKKSVAEDALEPSANLAKAVGDEQHPTMQSSPGCAAPSEEVDAAAQLTLMPVLPTEPMEGGQGGAILVTNAEFSEAVLPCLSQGAFAAVCSKVGNPDRGGRVVNPADVDGDNFPPEANKYDNCSIVYLCDGVAFKARKQQLVACHFLMLDDLGAKASPDRPNTHQGIADRQMLKMGPAARENRTAKSAGLPKHQPISIIADAGDALIPAQAEGKALTAFKRRPRYKTPIGLAKHKTTRPPEEANTDDLDTCAAYFEPGEFYPVGDFGCQHSRREKYHKTQSFTVRLNTSPHRLTKKITEAIATN
jgi:hypothetical protein